MKNLKKLLYASVFGLGLVFFMIPTKADASYRANYPSKYCDPQGFLGCGEKWPGEQ
jgi:hypothetical protein